MARPYNTSFRLKLRRERVLENLETKVKKLPKTKDSEQNPQVDRISQEIKTLRQRLFVSDK